MRLPVGIVDKTSFLYQIKRDSPPLTPRYATFVTLDELLKGYAAYREPWVRTSATLAGGRLRDVRPHPTIDPSLPPSRCALRNLRRNLLT